MAFNLDVLHYGGSDIHAILIGEHEHAIQFLWHRPLRLQVSRRGPHRQVLRGIVFRPVSTMAYIAASIY